jgi:hypothetical protein
VAGDHKDATDGQVVVGDVRKPQGFALGVETTKEGEDRGARAIGTTEGLIQAVGILGINAPVAREEGRQTCWVGQGTFISYLYSRILFICNSRKDA